MRRRISTLILAGVLLLSQLQVVPAAEWPDPGEGAVITAEADNAGGEEGLAADEETDVADIPAADVPVEEAEPTLEALAAGEETDVADIPAADVPVEEAEPTLEALAAGEETDVPADEIPAGKEGEVVAKDPAAGDVAETAEEAPADGDGAEPAAETQAADDAEAAEDAFEEPDVPLASNEDQEPYVEHHYNFGDCDLLPEWDHWIDKRFNTYVENANYPEGQDFDCEITEISIENEDIVEVNYEDENGYNLKAREMGSTTVSFTFKDWDGSDQTEEFTVNVGTDVYWVDLWPEDYSHRVLTGGGKNICAQVHHESYDPDAAEDHYHTYSEEELKDLDYQWALEFWDEEHADALGDLVTVTRDEDDSRYAYISFENVPEDWDRTNVNVSVGVFEDGNKVAANDTHIEMTPEYLELWPRTLDPNPGPGENFIIEPELRSYVRGQEGYSIVENAWFSVENYDENAYTVEVNDNIVEGQRFKEYETSFRVKAYIENEYGDEEEVDNVEYWLDERNYDIWYEIEGNDQIFSDGERTFRINLSNLEGVDFELVPMVGTDSWDDEKGCFITPIEDGWSYDSEAQTITFDGSWLKEQGYSWVEARLSVRVNGVECSVEHRGFAIVEPEYSCWNLLDGETLFPNEERFIDKSGTMFIRNNDYPDGADFEYTIESINCYVAGDASQTSSFLEIAEDDNGWNVTAAEYGDSTIEAQLLLNPSTDNIHFTKQSLVTVGTRRFWMNLVTDGGGDRLMVPDETLIFPACFLECYNDEHGYSYNDNPYNYDIVYDVECTYINDEIVEAAGSYEEAARQGYLWDYTLSDDGRSILLQTKEGAEAGIDLLVHAYLMEPGTDECVCEGSRYFGAGRVAHKLELVDADTGEVLDWNENIAPGEAVTVNPRVMVYGATEEPQTIEEFDTDDLSFTIGYYEGNYEENNLSHVLVTDKDGKIISDSTEISADSFPLTIERVVPWQFDIRIEATWVENSYGGEAYLYANYYCEDATYACGKFVDAEGNEITDLTLCDDGKTSIAPLAEFVKYEMNEEGSFTGERETLPIFEKDKTSYTVEYSGYDEDVISVGDDGQVTAKAAGDTGITANVFIFDDNDELVRTFELVLPVLVREHECDKWTTVTKATVFKTGKKTGVCKYCGEEMTATIKKVTPTIKLSKKSGKVAKTKSTTITVTYGNGDSISKVTTSDSTIATAKKSGKKVTITAKKKAGKATITVTLKSGKSAKFTVTVPKVNCTSITAKSSYTVTTKSTVDLGVTLKPALCDSTITYTSSNKKIATVTKKGVVKGVKKGTAYVTIKTSNGKSKRVKIVVKQGTNSIETNKSKYTVKKGKTVTIETTLNPTSSADKVTYSSSNKKIATVTSKGKVKGVKKGTVTITIKSGTITKKVKVTVK